MLCETAFIFFATTRRRAKPRGPALAVCPVNVHVWVILLGWLESEVDAGNRCGIVLYLGQVRVMGVQMTGRGRGSGLDRNRL